MDPQDDIRERIASLTPDQVMTGIARATEARDWPAVDALLKILAVKDPESAQAVYDTIIAVAASEAATAGAEEDTS